MVSTAVEFAVLVEVDEIHQQLLADRAGEASGMPNSRRASPGGSDADVSAQDSIPTLQGDNCHNGVYMKRCSSEEDIYEKETHAFARGRLGESNRHLLDGAVSQRVSLPLS